MRLKPEKIEQLAELVYDALAANAEVKLVGERKDVVFQIVKVVTEDLQAEEAIEAEARKLLEEHENELRRTGVRFDQALWKTKKKIARDKGFIL
jgi:hypothetical protein